MASLLCDIRICDSIFTCSDWITIIIKISDFSFSVK